MPKSSALEAERRIKYTIFKALLLLHVTLILFYCVACEYGGQHWWYSIMLAVPFYLFHYSLVYINVPFVRRAQVYFATYFVVSVWIFLNGEKLGGMRLSPRSSVPMILLVHYLCGLKSSLMWALAVISFATFVFVTGRSPVVPDVYCSYSGVLFSSVFFYGMIHLYSSAHTRLYTELMKTNESLERALARATEVGKQKEIFYYRMSHELRAPLQGILASEELLINREGDSTELGVIHSCANALRNVVNDLLDFAKFEGGELVLELAPFRLWTAVNSAVAIVKGLSDRKNISIEFKEETLEPALFCFVGDSKRLMQILVNILSNAVKFSPAYSTIKVFTDWEVNGNPLMPVNLSVRIQDEGCGIPEAELDTIFDAYSQASTAGTRVGTGLGLNVARTLARAMGGEVCVDSQVGSGSTFTVAVAVTTCTCRDLPQHICDPATRRNESSPHVTGPSAIVRTSPPRGEPWNHEEACLSPWDISKAMIALHGDIGSILVKFDVKAKGRSEVGNLIKETGLKLFNSHRATA